MKQVLLLLLTVLFAASNITAQTDPDCRIWYKYDAAGQRIQRYYECKDIYSEPIEHPIKLNVFPNPTDGPVIVVTDVSVDEFSAAIFTISGSLITSASCTDCSMLSLNIASQLTGTYVVQVTAVKQGYPNLNEGQQLIKKDD